MKIITWLLVLILTIAFFGIGNAFYQDDNTIDIYNVTSRIQWNESLLSYEAENHTEYTPVDKVYIGRIKGIVYKLLNFMGFTMFEVAKTGIELGFKYPHINLTSLVSFLPTFMYVVVGAIIITLLLKGLPIVLALAYIMYAFGKSIINKIKDKRIRNSGR